MAMKILLIMPDANIHKLNLGAWSVSFREAPLTLTALASLIPPDINAKVRIVDESIERIPYDEFFDLVGISCLTGTAQRGYAIANKWKQSGSTVVLGGIHVTLRPLEAAKYADSIVKGFAEDTWPRLLRDFVKGELKQTYESNVVSLQNLPPPRRDLQKRLGYMAPNSVFATRGCRRSCEFCTVAAVPFGWHVRPIAEVVEEIKKIPSARFVFNDVSIAEDREYAKALFRALVPLKKKWGGLVTLDVVQDQELMDLMAQSGCVYLLTGFETIHEKGLRGINKSFNAFQDYVFAMNEFHERKIMIQGCFIFGLDDDDKSVFKNTVDMVNALNIDIPRYAIYTPYPETKAFVRLKREGRILHENWSHYDTQHVVYQPARMSPKELDEGFRWAYRKTFLVNSIIRRMAGSSHSFITFMGNMAYRMYVRKLCRDTARLCP